MKYPIAKAIAITVKMIMIGRKIFSASSSGILVASSPISGASVLIGTAPFVGDGDGRTGSVFVVTTACEVVFGVVDSVFVVLVVTTVVVVIFGAVGSTFVVVVGSIVVVVVALVVVAIVEVVVIVVVVMVVVVAYIGSKSG